MLYSSVNSKRIFRFVFLLIAIAMIGIACSKDEDETEPVPTGGSGVLYDDTPYNLQYGSLPTPIIPGDNPLTNQGVELGRMLFYDKQLSGDGTLACAGCHVQSNGFSDTTQFSIGILGFPGGRQAMASFNMLWNNNEFFWDGRGGFIATYGAQNRLCHQMRDAEANFELEENEPNIGSTEVFRLSKSILPLINAKLEKVLDDLK